MTAYRPRVTSTECWTLRTAIGYAIDDESHKLRNAGSIEQARTITASIRAFSAMYVRIRDWQGERSAGELRSKRWTNEAETLLADMEANPATYFHGR